MTSVARETGGGHGVAVAVPVFREHLGADEQASWEQLVRVLGGREIVLVGPEGMVLPIRDRPTIRFPAGCFESVAAYSRLLLSGDFWRRFRSWEYLLIYQLDCLVFEDQLESWCGRGFDYVGAPWLVDPRVPERGFSRVGNGGFSLRRVASHLEVLTSRASPRWPRLLRELISGRLPESPGGSSVSGISDRARVLASLRVGAASYAACYTLNEDRFWSDRAAYFRPSFRVASVAEALGFAFEQAPRLCFERRGRQLPFGCHGWNRYDREFWQKFIG